MAKIGFSTGWLESKNVSHSLEEQVALVKAAGGNAIEIMYESCPHPENLLTEKIEGLRFLSLHLPPLSHVMLKHEALPAEFNLLCNVVRTLGVSVTVLHPPSVPHDVLEQLQNENILFAIENMDREKSSGKTIEDVATLMHTFGAPGVLDLQHAYENDKDAGGSGSTLGIAFVKMMQENLSHVHVSGETEKTNHALLQHAENREEILHALREIDHSTPLICEGEVLPELPVGTHPKSEEERQEWMKRVMEEMQKEVILLKEALRGSS